MPPTIHRHPWYSDAHHAPGGGFENPTPSDAPPTLTTLKWVVQHAFQQKQNTPPPVRPIAPEQLAAPASGLRLTWVGHSTVLLQTPTRTLLTDPMFGERASPVPFAGPERLPDLPVTIDALPPIDLVLLSHDHYDHLDAGSIDALLDHSAPTFVVPLGLSSLLQRWGAKSVLELDWWQYVDLDGVRLHCTPARHFSGRSFHSRDRTLWASWYLEISETGQSVYYAGDTAYDGHFRAIRERLGAPEVALVPIGAYRPRWFMAPVHVEPAEAVRAIDDLQARHAIPIHWGTFDLADEPVQEPAGLVREYARRHALADRIHFLDIGGSFALS